MPLVVGSLHPLAGVDDRFDGEFADRASDMVVVTVEHLGA